MTNVELLKQLEEIKWIENISKNADYVLDDIVKARKNPSDKVSFSLVEGVIDECDDMYDLYVPLSKLIAITDNDLSINEVEHLCEQDITTPESLIAELNTLLKNKGIEKSYYIFPREDQLAFMVYKPISVYNEAIKRNLI